MSESGARKKKATHLTETTPKHPTQQQRNTDVQYPRIIQRLLRYNTDTKAGRTIINLIKVGGLPQRDAVYIGLTRQDLIWYKRVDSTVC